MYAARLMSAQLVLANNDIWSSCDAGSRSFRLVTSVHGCSSSDVLATWMVCKEFCKVSGYAECIADAGSCSALCRQHQRLLGPMPLYEACRAVQEAVSSDRPLCTTNRRCS